MNENRESRLPRRSNEKADEASVDLVESASDRTPILLQSSVQILREKTVHQKSLGEIPRADEIERVLVIGKLHER